MTPGLPAPRDSEAKLQHILLHSARIFAEQGFEGASIRDISRSTGISLSGLYYYFESKQKLLYLIQSTAFTLIIDQLESRLALIREPEARLRALVRNHIEYFLAHPNEMKVLSHEEDALNPPYRGEVDAIKRRYYALAREIFDELVPRDSTQNVNARVAVLSLFGMMNWIYKWHKPEVDPDASELTDAIVGIFLRGVTTTNAEDSAMFTADQSGGHSD